MATTMTVFDFKQWMMEIAHARTGLKSYCEYIKHTTREDKYFREEYLPILTVVNFKQIPDNEQIELGNEIECWDARINNQDVYEIVQALPTDEHEVRRELPNGLRPVDFFIHANDHLQFPDVIVDAIEMKHAKGYTDSRSLVVTFDGAYSGEDDGVIDKWIQDIRNRTKLGVFKEILLVERDRRKVFPLF